MAVEGEPAQPIPAVGSTTKPRRSLQMDRESFPEARAFKCAATSAVLYHNTKRFSATWKGSNHSLGDQEAGMVKAAAFLRRPLGSAGG